MGVFQPNSIRQNKRGLKLAAHARTQDPVCLRVPQGSLKSHLLGKEEAGSLAEVTAGSVLPYPPQRPQESESQGDRTSDTQ